MRSKPALIPAGELYGRLTAIGNRTYYDGPRKRRAVLCSCACGELKEIAINNLTSGRTLSCGCLNKETRKRLSANYQGANHPRWKGGIKKDQHGYTMLYAKGGPSSNSNGYIQEHRQIVERVLGRSLKPSEIVHHVDGDKGNNSNNNLVLCDAGYHQTIHRRTRALKESGSADSMKCPFCKQYDNPNNMVLATNGSMYHKQCMRDYKKNYSNNRRTRNDNKPTRKKREFTV